MQFSVLSVELTLITPTQYLYISVLLSLLLPLTILPYMYTHLYVTDYCSATIFYL